MVAQGRNQSAYVSTKPGRDWPAVLDKWFPRILRNSYSAKECIVTNNVDFGLRVKTVSEVEMLIAPVLMRHDGQLLVLVRADSDEDGSDLRLRVPVPIEDYLKQHKAKIVGFFPTPVNKNLRTVVFQSEFRDVDLQISMSDNPQPWMVSAAEEMTRRLGTPMPPEQVADLWKAVLAAERERAARLGEPFEPVASGSDYEGENEDDEVTVQEFLADLMSGTAEDFALGVAPNGRRVHVGSANIKEMNLRDFLAFMRTFGLNGK